jgi:hypothetical protein
VKACPTCGREIAESVSVCDACDAWAAALAEPRPDDAEPLKTIDAPTAEETAPVAAAKAAPAGRPAASRRQLTYIAAGIGVVALTGFAISARGGSASDASVAAPAPAPAATGRPAPSAAPAPAAAAATAAAATAVQTWSADNRNTWLGPRVRGAAFELLSEKAVKTWSGSARPSLVVRCTPHTIEAFIVTGSPLKIEPRIEGKRVTTSVDGEPLRTEHWVDADDRTAVFAPDPAAFVQRLRNGRSLAFGYSPHNSTDVVAQFNVAGIDPLIGAAAAKECRAPAVNAGQRKRASSRR